MTMLRVTSIIPRNMVLITLHGGLVDAVFVPISEPLVEKGHSDGYLILIPLLGAHGFASLHDLAHIGEKCSRNY
jgi:hypothetical protein